MTKDSEFSKTIECPHCGMLITIKFKYNVEIGKFDIYKIVGM